MTSKQEQHEIDTTVQALLKREQQVRKAIERGYFSSTTEVHQLTRDIFIGYSTAVETHIVHQALSSCVVDAPEMDHNHNYAPHGALQAPLRGN